MPHYDNKIDYDVGDLVHLRYLCWEDPDFDRLHRYQNSYNYIQWKGLAVDIDLSDDLLIVSVLIDDQVFKGLKASNWYKVPDEHCEPKV